MDAVRAACIRTLYVQARNSAVAALVVTLYMIVASWPYSSHEAIMSWLAVMAPAQLGRFGLILAFRRAAPPDEALPRWARDYTAYMLLAGLLWGATAFLFMHANQPITIALTLCGLYGISSGSVPGNAYNPPGLNVFVVSIFGCVLIELLRQQQFVFIVLGFASAAFAAILILFCRVQARDIRESFRMRFENQALLKALTIQREVAETARGEAEQASLAKSQFLAAASHDLRQPLHALSLLAGSLNLAGLNAATQRIITEMLNNIRALEGLFNGLLDMARLDAGVVRVKRTALPADELFDRLNHFLAATSAEREIDLRFRSDGSVLFTDPVLIEQIMLNLASNALRNTARGGGVLCAARRRGRGVRLEVWDTGKGIAAEAIVRIFDDFVQIDNDERDRRKGMGLGLAITRRAAGLLGAEVGVASRPGRGSVFWLAQPMSEDAPALSVAAVKVRKAEPTGATHVLVIDDDEAVRQALALLLAEWAVPCRIVATPEEGDAALEAEGCSHVLCDHRLPGARSGLDLLQTIRAAAAKGGPALYLITGDMDAALIARADEAGIALLHKPLSPDLLRSILGLAPRRAIA